jgi:hypothetical protein
VAALVASVLVPVALVTLLIEAAALAWGWSRWSAIAVAAGLISFHVMVFLLSGFAFWKWVIALLAVTAGVVLYARHGRPLLGWRGVLGVVLITGVAVVALRPASLGWFDTRLTTYFQYVVVADDGQRFTLNRADFAPFQQGILVDDLSAIDPARPLVTNWSTPRLELFRELQAAAPQDVAAIRSRLGGPPAAAAARERLAGTMTSLVCGLAHFGVAPAVVPPLLRAPLHGRQAATPGDFQFDRGIERVEIRAVDSFYDGQATSVIRDDLVLAVTPATDCAGPMAALEAASVR